MINADAVLGHQFLKDEKIPLQAVRFAGGRSTTEL